MLTLGSFKNIYLKSHWGDNGPCFILKLKHRLSFSHHSFQLAPSSHYPMYYLDILTQLMFNHYRKTVYKDFLLALSSETYTCWGRPLSFNTWLHHNRRKYKKSYFRPYYNYGVLLEGLWLWQKRRQWSGDLHFWFKIVHEHEPM